MTRIAPAILVIGALAGCRAPSNSFVGGIGPGPDFAGAPPGSDLAYTPSAAPDLATVGREAPPDLAMPAMQGGTCGVYALPDTASCCTSCKNGNHQCQTNGCYGGWACDTTSCKCAAPPANCDNGNMGNNGGADMAVNPQQPPPKGTIGPQGGSVSYLYFAVVGDTRPQNEDDTGGYPTQVVEKIYADIEAMNPRPQFVLTTGDYQFAAPNGQEGAKQLALYQKAASQFTGPVFAAMGNHECTGATASNCANGPTNNMQAFLDTMIKPLGQTNPYYTIPFSDVNGQWTAKLVIVACNAWDNTQQSWLQSELAKPTTYTFVSRHEPTGTYGPPCVSAMDSMLQRASYDLFIVGHSHEFRKNSNKEFIIGNGGAPLSGGGGNFGYATVQQQPGGGFVVTQYDYMSAAPVASYNVQ